VEEELDFIKLFVGLNPGAGNVVPGTGGARKIRFPLRGRGKSGGFRVITFYSGANIPVFLIDIYSKRERENITQTRKNSIRKSVLRILETYGR
jgi:hypothetical protein